MACEAAGVTRVAVAVPVGWDDELAALDVGVHTGDAAGCDDEDGEVPLLMHVP